MRIVHNPPKTLYKLDSKELSIKEVKIVEETPQFVFEYIRRGYYKRCGRHTTDISYFESAIEAKQKLIEVLSDLVEHYATKHAYFLDRLKELDKPIGSIIIKE